MGRERKASDDAAMDVANSVSDGTFHAPVVQAAAVNGGVHTYYGQPHFSVLPPVSEWPRLDTADPIALGVRRARRLPGESPLPSYVERDCDAELADRVRKAARFGGLVVVTGGPLSGKSRTAWVSLSANLSGATRVFAPSPGTDLRGLPAAFRVRGEVGCALWLDGLEAHLGEHGLTPAILAELVRLRVPVLATMDDEVYDARRFGASGRAEVLSWADPVELQRAWSRDELLRLEGRGDDFRLLDAEFWRGEVTVPEYLAVGPELMEEWWRARRPNAHPRGHLLVRVAIDLARCVGGDEVAFSVDVLNRAQALYPENASASVGESFEEGLAWATKLRHGVTGLLVSGAEKGTWAVFGSLFADVYERSDSSPVPLGMWVIALQEVLGDQEAEEAIVYEAHRTLTPCDETDSDTLLVLGHINAVIGALDAAESWYRKAADAGNAEAALAAGELLAAVDKVAEAIPYFETAAEAGIADAQYLLGRALADRAQDWLTRAAEAGHPAAKLALPPLRKVTETRPDTVKE